MTQSELELTSALAAIAIGLRRGGDCWQVREWLRVHGVDHTGMNAAKLLLAVADAALEPHEEEAKRDRVEVLQKLAKTIRNKADLEATLSTAHPELVDHLRRSLKPLLHFDTEEQPGVPE